MENNPKYILVHCSDVPYSTSTDQLKQINEYHRDVRGFPMSSLRYHVGYQHLITGGRDNQCRLDTDEGAHCNMIVDGISMNFQSLGVCIGFDGDVEYPTDLDRSLLQKCIWAWQAKYSIPNERVMFHRDFDNKGKTCPGTLITRKWLDKLLERPAPVAQVIIPQVVDMNWVARFIAAWLKLFPKK